MSLPISGSSMQAQTVVVRAGPCYIPAQITSSGDLLLTSHPEESQATAHVTAAALATLQHSSVIYNETPCYPIRTTFSVYPMHEKWYPIIVSAATNPAGTMQIIVQLNTHDPTTENTITHYFGQSQNDAVQLSSTLARIAQLPFNENLGPILHTVASAQQVAFVRIRGLNSVYFLNQ